MAIEAQQYEQKYSMAIQGIPRIRCLACRLQTVLFRLGNSPHWLDTLVMQEDGHAD